MKGSRIRQVLRLLGRDDAAKPDLTGMGRRDVSADVAPRGGMCAVNTSDDTRDDLIALLKVQAHACNLIG
jgi:hypothetical protein